MIAKLTGEIVDVRITQVIVQVGGIGYLVAVANGTQFTIGSFVELHTHLAVRENALDLYGFSNRDEQYMFEQLIKLPKIGPKTAMQILSQASIEILQKAVRTDDATYLSKMSGIGKKSAEKIVAGLKDSIGEDVLLGEHSAENQSDSDVVDALITLGYSQRDALHAVQKIPGDITDTKARVTHALKYIGS